MAAVKLKTRTGRRDRALQRHPASRSPPLDRPRKVVYSGFRLRLRPGDALEAVSVEQQRAERAHLTDVQDRIASAGARRPGERIREDG